MAGAHSSIRFGVVMVPVSKFFTKKPTDKVHGFDIPYLEHNFLSPVYYCIFAQRNVERFLFVHIATFCSHEL